MDKNEENISQNGFLSPEGYFSELHSRVINRIGWEEELKDFPILLNLRGQSGMTIPSGYFSKNEANIEILTEKLTFTKLPTADKSVFLVPANYFNEGSRKIISIIWDTSSDCEINPLFGLPKSTGFIVPDNYFDSVKAKFENDASAKVISINGTKKQWQWWSVAASIIGIILLSVFFLKKQPAAELTCQSIACLEKSEILNSGVFNLMDESFLMDVLIESREYSTDKVALDTLLELNQSEILEHIDTELLTEEI